MLRAPAGAASVCTPEELSSSCSATGEAAAAAGTAAGASFPGDPFEDIARRLFAQDEQECSFLLHFNVLLAECTRAIAVHQNLKAQMIRPEL